MDGYRDKILKYTKIYGLGFCQIVVGCFWNIITLENSNLLLGSEDSGTDHPAPLTHTVSHQAAAADLQASGAFSKLMHSSVQGVQLVEEY